MNCQSINGLQLDGESIRAVEEIRRKRGLANFISGALSGAILGNILSTGNSLVMSFNIYQTDFQL